MLSSLLVREPLGDGDYRRLIKARIVTLASSGSEPSYQAALEHLDSGRYGHGQFRYDLYSNVNSLRACGTS